LCLWKGDLDEAIPAVEGGLSFCEISWLSAYFILVSTSLGYTYALSGRVAEAFPLLNGVLEEVQRPELRRRWHAPSMPWRTLVSIRNADTRPIPCGFSTRSPRGASPRMSPRPKLQSKHS